MKEFASRYEKHINLQSQLLAIANGKYKQSFDIESQDSTIVEEKRSQFVDIADHMDVNEIPFNQET
jgi:hypothetical protein